MKFFQLLFWCGSLAVGFSTTLRAQPMVTLVSSDFEVTNNLDGWRGTNNSGNSRPVTYQPGGPTSNSVGYISMVEGVADSSFNHFIAPDKFLGDQRAAYNGLLTFYYRKTVTGGGNAGNGIVKLFADTNQLSFDLPYPPAGNVWHHFAIPLNENAGWRFLPATNNHRATREEMLSVLSGLTLMQIRAEWAGVNNEVDDIDDVMFLGQPSGAPEPGLGIATFAGLTVTGAVGSTYTIEYRDALDASTNWFPLTNLVLPHTPYLFVDTNSPSAASRFYRAVLNP
jgi:hypothetical protein